VQLDIKYATDENFTGQVVYPAARAFARLPVAKALKKIQLELQNQDLGLKIYDAYRPYTITLLFWDLIGDTTYVAPPWIGSKHNRGCSVDVSIIDAESGEELEMPTPYDDFSPEAAANYADVTPDALKNREALIYLMSKYGFQVYPSEWWHFDFKGWQGFELMDVSFDELDSAGKNETR